MYDESAFNEQINENLADDPYGTATYLIQQVLWGTAQHNGAMNTQEAENMWLLTHAFAHIDMDRATGLPTAADFGLDITKGGE